MENGQIYDGNIGVHEWKYYRYSLMDQDQSLQIILNETSLDTSIDCDLYVRLNKYPTTRRFTYSEVSVNQNSSIYIDAAATRGNYFIGVYGFQKCEFVIEAIQKGPCPNSCSGHGVCDVSSHTCNCDVGYGGDDCSLFNKTITNGEQVEGSIQAQQWNYYYFDNTVSGLINVTLISSTDPDIYVKKETLPTVFVWDYANATSFTTTSIIIPEATPGRYYIGVFGYATSTYTLTVNAAQMVCQSSCSNHGSCSGTVCQCQNNFSGLICENMTTSLENGQSVTGFVTSNVWNYYYFTSNTESNLIFTLHKLNVAGDADLFVERDSYPNITYYDYFNASSAPFTSVTVDQPGIRNWYIGVVGWSNTNYTIRVDIATTCNCVHGTCNADGVCVCELGWAGDSCDTVASLIQRNTLISGSVKNGEWLYYYFPATAHHISVVMKETSTAGMVWSYLHRDTFPTLRHHDAADRESETPYHLVSSSTKQVATKEYNYFVGFYGSPFIELNSTVSFSFEVWYF